MWTAINKLTVFFGQVFQAFKFAAYDYDVTLRRTKTPLQRIIIWAAISLVIVAVLVGLLFSLKYIVQTLVKERFTDKILER